MKDGSDTGRRQPRLTWMSWVARAACAACAIGIVAGASPAHAEEASRLWIVSRPPGAHVVLDGAMRVEGVTPFAIDRGVAGVYEVTARIPGYSVWRSPVRLSATSGDSLVIPLQELTRSGAFLRAVVFPGWGQRYAGRRGQGALIFYSTAAMGAAAVYEQTRYTSAREEYDRSRDVYAGASGSEAIRAAYTAMDSRYQDLRDRRDRRNGFLLAGAVVWAAGIVDALVHPQEESHVDISAVPAGGGTVSLALKREF